MGKSTLIVTNNLWINNGIFYLHELVDVEDGRKFLKSSFKMDIVDGRLHEACLLEIAEEKDEDCKWAGELLRVCELRRKDAIKSNARESINSSGTNNRTTELVRSDDSFVDPFQWIINHSKSFELQYNFPFSKARIPDIVTDLMRTDFCLERSHTLWK